MRFAEDWTATRQPTEHVVHVDSTWSRSHGRALNRYGVAVSAPTGQICTVLPEKCEVKGSVGKAATSTSSPRPAKSIWASPATSAAKRVQRLHWMQRSRSSSTRSDSAMGFSKWRFSSEEPGVAGAVRERLVLQGALAALVADRAVQGMVDQEELQDAVLGLLHLVGVRDDGHVLGDRHVAGRLQRGAARAVDLDEAHSADADRRHPRVVAEPRARTCRPAPPRR